MVLYNIHSSVFSIFWTKREDEKIHVHNYLETRNKTTWPKRIPALLMMFIISTVNSDKKRIYWFLKVEVYPIFQMICCISIYWKLSFILSQTIAPNLNSFVGLKFPQTKPFYEFRNELDIVCSKHWWEIFVETGLPYFYHPEVTRDISCRKLPAEKRCKKITNFNELNECGDIQSHKMLCR